MLVARIWPQISSEPRSGIAQDALTALALLGLVFMPGN